MACVKMNIKECKIKGLFLVTPFYADDDRGCFIKDYEEDYFMKNGAAHHVAEAFYTTSHKGVLRGLHFQRIKQQAKLVRCLSGHIYDVVVDLRPYSPTFKSWLGFELTGEDRQEILVPGGCGHGFLAFETSLVSYKCSEKFHSEYDDGIRWDDPELNIDWPIQRIGNADSLIMSSKDKNLQYFSDFMEKYGGLK